MQVSLIALVFQFMVIVSLSTYINKLLKAIVDLQNEKDKMEEEYDEFVEMVSKEEVARQDDIGQRLMDTLEKEIFSQMLLNTEPYGDA